MDWYVCAGPEKREGVVKCMFNEIRAKKVKFRKAHTLSTEQRLTLAANKLHQ